MTLAEYRNWQACVHSAEAADARLSLAEQRQQEQPPALALDDDQDGNTESHD